MSPRPAAFLDRDGCIIEDSGFVKDPGAVTLVPGAADAIRRLNSAGWPVVVITNQSGIARGLLSEADYHAVARRTDQLLAGEGAWLDATYMCPHWPELSGPCDCRKPGLKHYRDAIAAFDIDPARSLYCGDKLTDLLPARILGGKGLLVRTGEGSDWECQALEAGFEVVPDLVGAVEAMGIRSFDDLAI